MRNGRTGWAGRMNEGVWQAGRHESDDPGAQRKEITVSLQ